MRKDSTENIQSILNRKEIQITLLGEYVNQKTPILCECNVCKCRWYSKSGALKKWKGTSCRYCSRGWLRSIEDFRDRLEEVGRKVSVSESGEKYKYIAQCQVCDYHWESTSSNLLINGCARCSKKEKGSLVRTQKYLDSKGSEVKVSGTYKNAYTKLNCKCQICSTEWEAHSHNLINNDRGCPSCARSGFDPSKPGYLYYLRVSQENEVYWKIGITNLSVKERFNHCDREKITTLYCHRFEHGLDAQVSERNILNIYNEYRAVGVKILKSGNTELFTKDVLGMDHLANRGLDNWP